MRILHVIPSVSPEWGGPSSAIVNFVYHLRLEGIHAEVITTNSIDENLFNVPVEEWIEYENIPVCFFPVTFRIKAFAPSLRLNAWLRKHIFHYDLIHTHYLFSYAPTVAAALARQHCIPYVVSTIGQLTPWALAQSSLSKKVYSQLFERKTLQNAAAIHCTTVGEAQDVTNFDIDTPKLVLPLGVTPTEPIPNAAYNLKHCYNIPQNHLIILFLSRLHYKKRPDLLIKAIGQLSPHLPPSHLLLAGSGDSSYCRYLQNCIDTIGLHSRVTFTGFVSGSQKSLLLQGADLFVLPSFSENFGIAVAEALLAGLPVIITDGIQLSSDVQAAQAGLVIPSEIDPLRSALEKLLSSPDLRQTLGRNAQNLARTKYHWPSITKNLIHAYQDILHGEFDGNYP